MIAAAYPFRTDEAELEGSAAVRAVTLQEADRAAAVAKDDQLLAEDFDRQRQVFQVIGVADRLPNRRRYSPPGASGPT